MKKMELYDSVRTVPESAKKKITGGRLNGKTDINPMWRIKVLTEQFGPCGVGWFYEVTKQWIEQYGEEVAAFVNINLYIKFDGEWSRPIHGIGGSMFAEKQSKGIYVSDECYKMATTDAISVACKQLGIGADVYFEKDITKYNENNDENQVIKERLAPVMKELSRIGYSIKSICKTYKLNDISEISDLQIKDFLQKAKNISDKEQTS